MTQTHYFNVNIANSYGLNCAVLLQNMWHWVCENEKKGINFHDGYYWTYNTVNEFINIMPYLKKSQINTAMKILRNEGIIITGNYNTKKYDRTLWYTVTSKGKSILQKGKMDIPENANSISDTTEMDFRKNANSISDITEMDFPKNRNGFPLHEKPIPNINTNINTDINTAINTDIYTASVTSSRKRCTSAEVKKIISHLNEKLGSAYKATTRSTLTHINARFSEGFTLEDFIKVIDKKCDEWGKDEKMQRFLRPETLFGTKFESYLNAPSKDKKGSEQSAPLILSENARLLYELYKDEEF